MVLTVVTAFLLKSRPGSCCLKSHPKRQHAWIHQLQWYLIQETFLFLSSEHYQDILFSLFPLEHYDPSTKLHSHPGLLQSNKFLSTLVHTFLNSIDLQQIFQDLFFQLYLFTSYFLCSLLLSFFLQKIPSFSNTLSINILTTYYTFKFNLLQQNLKKV